MKKKKETMKIVLSFIFLISAILVTVYISIKILNTETEPPICQNSCKLPPDIENGFYYEGTFYKLYED